MRRSSGFTIIELLIVLLIMATLIGTGVAGFREFNRRQKVMTTKNALVSALRFAQSEAASGNRAGCVGVFGGYLFNINPSNYTISASCDGGNVVVRNVELDEGVVVSVSGDFPIIFLPLAQGVDIPAGTESLITISAQGSEEIITINSQGKIK
ncbi:MAG: hypothetical protein UV74_C0013G0164 [Candidatus Woesebacteria bacterium GW2011_GWB1_43_14]|uniref:General secretion pathway GspH domain-containing protein n=1 Tax=Candidatus Woesebacteria bacterium GW2011_GWB1_43_14 TaxID=1618578 RepID=A0A0G1DHH2_9BACT|nr:MAG: protein of unknown function with transmembrane region [Candidatus Woesebacteria bacterium GW2011_GWC1_42_9]KKS97042.1 MAG: hypothetical protein UV74_C0013G0164 [Candidatus Woesebacteria bacterium GW2011_GWB1_43_14]